MLLLATSCLQGEPLVRACLTLLALQPDGLQLCPGHPPSAGLDLLLRRVDTTLRAHHGFSWSAFRQPVWSPSGDLLLSCSGEGVDVVRSLHPPRDGPPMGLEAWLDRAVVEGWILEVMPPGWLLSTEPEVDAAMARGVRLAVDVSHLHILRTAGRLSSTGARRLLDYAQVAEVHVSDNDGHRDLHRPLTPQSYGLGWARERTSTQLPLVLECYMHRLDTGARHQQIERLRRP